jgi:hypothetical protein
MSVELKPGKQVTIPETTPSRYITGIAALNLPAPEGTNGDWHFSTVFYSNDDEPAELQLAGDGEALNTNHIYGQYGIYECSAAMGRTGLDVPTGNVYSANHFRAILDMLYWSLARHNRVIGLIGATEDWLDTQDQKNFLLLKANDLLPYLRERERAGLQSWIDQERLPGYRS